MKAGFHHLGTPAGLVALSFGLGLIPWMPGTFGAAGAFLIYPLLLHLPWLLQCVIVVALLLLGWLACDRASKLLGGEDPSAIVWDETVGMLIVLVLTPASLTSWLVGFIAFRLLDIRKPWIIGEAERKLSGGLAIMADDAVAGLGAAAAVWIVIWALSMFTTG